MSQSRSPSARPRLVTPAFVLVTVALFVYFLAIGMVLPVLPLFVTGRLGGGVVSVGVSVGAFSVSALVLRPIAGRIGDVRGRRLLLLVGASLVSIAMAGTLLVRGLPLLVALRLVAGAGEAFFFVGAASVVNDLAPDERRGEAVSLSSLALYSAIAIGPAIGEAILDVDRFDAVWIAAALSAGGALLLSWFVHETRPEPIEGAGRSRLVHPAAVLPGLAVMASVWGASGFTAFTALYAREIGLGSSGLVFVLFGVVVLGVRSVGATIPDRVGFVRTARVSLGCSAAGLLVIGLVRSPAGLFAGTAVFALGQALAFPALMSIAVGDAPASERGAVVGTFTAFVDIAFGLGAFTLGAVAGAAGIPGTFVASALVTAIGLVVLARVRVRPGTELDLRDVADPAP